MSTEVSMLAKMLSDEMIEREADREENSQLLKAERIKSARMDALESAVVKIQASLAQLVKEFAKIEEKTPPVAAAAIDDRALARIEQLLKVTPKSEKPKEITFDIIRDELGTPIKIIAKR